MDDSPNLQFVRGGDAAALFIDGKFLAGWEDLHRACPWATAYQSPRFAVAWYRAYAKLYEPLLIYRGEFGVLRGLMALAVRREGRRVVVAGSHQAEYQAWLSRPGDQGDFERLAIDVVRRAFPEMTLKWKYLPPGIPLDVAQSPELSGLTRVGRHHRPIMCFGDGKESEASLKKPGNKSRLRQLAKLGKVEFRHVEEPARFPALLDECIKHYDARFTALHGSAPFANDPAKREFHLAMMRSPGLMHVTTLRVGGRLASAHLNLVSGRLVHLNLIAHDSSFDPYSPGKLHMLLLARLLHQQGFARLDLTPGGDAYKERFANARDEVGEWALYPTVARRVAGGVAADLGALFKRARRAVASGRASCRGIIRNYLAGFAREPRPGYRIVRRSTVETARKRAG